MSFLYPTFLWAMTATLIPVIIHLFSFRRHKTVYFSQTRFLESIKNDNKNRSKLKHFIILLIRILIIAALVFAFSGPIILDKEESRTTDSNRYIPVYIDNSYSMMNENENGNLLNISKQYAISIAESYGNEYQFFLLSNAMSPMHFRPMSKDVFITECGKIDYASTDRSLYEICMRAESLTKPLSENSKNTSLYLISDFQTYKSNLSSLSSFKNLAISALPVKPVLRQNLSIDSVWFETPFRRKNQEETLYVSINNHGDNTYSEVPVRLKINDSIKAIASINLEENATTTSQLTFVNSSEGTQRAEVYIDDYPIHFDNHLYFSYELNSSRNLLIIEENTSGNFPEALFSENKDINSEIVKLSELDISSISNYDIVILNGIHKLDNGLQSQLIQFLSESGIIWLIPNESADITTWNSFLQKNNAPILKKWATKKREISKLEWEHPFFKAVFPEKQKGVSFPSFSGSWEFSKSNNNLSESLIKYRDNGSFLEFSKSESSFMYLISAPLHNKKDNFYRHPLIIPIAYNIVLNKPSNIDLYYNCGAPSTIELKSTNRINESSIEIRKGEEAIIPTWKQTGQSTIVIYIPEIMDQAGQYEIYSENSQIGSFSLNTKSNESEMKFLSIEEIETTISEESLDMKIISTDNADKLQSQIITENFGKKLWFWFILTALVLIISEILVIRFIKE